MKIMELQTVDFGSESEKELETYLFWYRNAYRDRIEESRESFESLLARESADLPLAQPVSKDQMH